MDENTDKPLGALLESKNIAEILSEEKLHKIGADAFKGFDHDLQSRHEWDKHIDEWTKLAKQTIEQKAFPWPKASNVKYPLLTTAAMQFAARAYPSLVPSNGKIVNAKPIGKDQDGTKSKVAEAVSIYMSWQILEEMESWEEEMDKLLIMLPIVGTMFKKTYWDALNETNCSRLVLPKNLVVNYWAKSLKEAERISEIIEMSPRKVKERQQSKMWLDIDLGQAPQPETSKPMAPSVQDETTPYSIIEQHTFLDLDDDGYKEPYIVTFHKESKRVLRIIPRFDDKTIKLDQDGKIKKIDPIQYYTKFGFIPNPDGGFYDIGFGVLLGPINESVNTLINQIIDAGSLNNLQSGFLGKGLRIRMGETRFQPGEWKVVNSTGDDLKKQIVPMPSKEPSNVLFQLMGSLITSGKELASVAEIFVGKMPGQNTPATTTMATIEQGMKVFTAVYKRIYRALSEEFDKIARLNNLYLNPSTYVDIVDMGVNPDDFDMSKHNIFPGADPTAISQTEKLMKAQGLMELLQTGVIDPVKVVMRVLDAQEQPNWQELIKPEITQSGQMPPPQPDPKVQALQMKAQMDQQAHQQEMEISAQQAELDSRDKQQQMAMSAMASRQKIEEQAQLARIKTASQLQADNARIAGAEAQAKQSIVHNEQSHQQSMRHAEQAAQQKAKEPSKGVTKK